MRKTSLGSVLLICAAYLFGPSAMAAAPQTMTYVDASYGYPFAYLIEPAAGGQVRVVDEGGSGQGTLQTVSTGQSITMTQPHTDLYASGEDECGLVDVLRRIDQLLIRPISGTALLGRSELVLIGTLTYVGGCNNGLIENFGSTTDPGRLMLHRAMSKREPMTDLVPGAQLAGMKEGVVGVPPLGYIAADVVTFLPGARLRFTTTNTTLPIQKTSDGWLLLPLSGILRGYTRLGTDRTYGVERWLEASFVNGVATTVQPAMMVKPVAGTSFGSTRQASRHWESALYLGTTTPFYIDLYKNGTGERINLDLETGDESRIPLSWKFDGLNIVQDFPSIGRTRTWQPLATHGKAHFVMESETYQADGGPAPYIPPRVNFYVDLGPSVPTQTYSAPGTLRSTGAKAIQAGDAAGRGLVQ